MATRTSKQDTRQDNQQPNHLPAALNVDVLVDGEKLGSIGVPQAAKLSEKGNISFSGGIRPAAGWQLPGDDVNEALRSLSFAIEGTPLSVAVSGVHKSEKGNATVCHTGIVEVPSAEGDPVRYMAQLYTTYSTAKESYTLSVRIFKAGTPTSGPALVGTVTGGFNFENVA